MGLTVQTRRSIEIVQRWIESGDERFPFQIAAEIEQEQREEAAIIAENMGAPEVAAAIRGSE